MSNVGTIYSVISCGLGNQLFQYAQGLALSIQNRMNHAVVLDELNYSTNHNGYQLPLILKHPPRVASKKEINQNFGLISQRKVRKIVATNHKLGKLYPRFIQEDSHAFKAISNINRERNYLLRGFWQSEKYFTDFRKNIIENIIHYRHNPGQGPADIPSSTSVHVRGGDYLIEKNKNTFYQSSQLYYTAAISKILETDPKTHFFLFSDDFDYARSIMPNDINFTEVTQNTGEKSYLDIVLMSQCRNNIITNSTFSWWGAWLNGKPDKTVIAPLRWFHPSSSLSEEDIIPKIWNRL